MTVDLLMDGSYTTDLKLELQWHAERFDWRLQKYLCLTGIDLLNYVQSQS